MTLKGYGGFDGWRLDAPEDLEIRVLPQPDDLGWCRTITACEDPSKIVVQVRPRERFAAEVKP
jgi:hypothetical protein